MNPNLGPLGEKQKCYLCAMQLSEFWKFVLAEVILRIVKKCSIDKNKIFQPSKCLKPEFDSCSSDKKMVKLFMGLNLVPEFYLNPTILTCTS